MPIIATSTRSRATAKPSVFRPKWALLGAAVLSASLVGLGNNNARAGEPEATIVQGEGQDRSAVLAQLSQGLDLETALYLALDNNYQIRQAQERVLRQMAVVREARGALLPAVTGRGEWTDMEDSLIESSGGGTNVLGGGGSFRARDTENWNTALEASQVIFAGGSDWAFMRAQLQLLAANKAELLALINESALGVKQRYYDVLLAYAQIGVQEDLLALREAELTNAQNRLDAGVGSNFEALRARVAVSNARPELIRARNSYAINLQELRRYIGLKELGEEGLKLSGNLVAEDITINEKEALLTADMKRPEIAQLTLILEARRSGVSVEVGRLLPTVEAFVNYQVNRAQSTSPDDNLSGFMWGVRSNWNIFDGGATRSRVRQARSDVRSAELNLDELRFNIEVEVRRAYIGLVNARELVKASEQTITEAEESLRLANSRLEVGAATQLDILDAQVALTQARTNRIQALRDQNVAAATLETAIGQGVPAEFVLPDVVMDEKKRVKVDVDAPPATVTE